MDLLVLADPTGAVDMTADAISRRTNVPIEKINEALAELSAPDTQSRSPNDDGRRIVLLDPHRVWGWQIVNYEHYRQLRDEEARRSYFREYQRERRGKLVKDKKVTKKSHAPLNDVNTCQHLLTQEEVEEEVSKTPLPPKRGNGRRESRIPESDEAKRIAKIFNRRATTGWSHKEIKAFKALMPIDHEDLEAVEDFYEEEGAKPENYLRRELITFLNNFRGEVDKARGAGTTHKNSMPKIPNIG